MTIRPGEPRQTDAWRRALVLVAVVLASLGSTTARALAHGDVRVVDEVIELGPGASVGFGAVLHYHRLVGEVDGDGPVRLRLVASGSGDDVLVLGPGRQLSFNALVRCCEEVWAPHRLVLENPGDTLVRVAARVHLVHDDLAVMVDGAESGSRGAIVLLGIGWSALVWRAARRRDGRVLLRRSMVGLGALTTFVLGVAAHANRRYGVGGAPGVVAGNLDLPVLPLNPLVSRASLLMGIAMLGWALTGSWWVRARPEGPVGAAWLLTGAAFVGAVLVVAVAVTLAYGGPLVQSAWSVAAAGPLVVVLVAALSDRWPTGSVPPS